MDSALLSMMQSGGRNRAWAETMVNMEARKLVNLASQLSAFHLSDGLTRIKFCQEIKDVVEQQFALAHKAKSDEECIACISALRAEQENLHEQSRMLRMKAAKLYAKVEFVRENNKIVGYVISAVHVVLSSVSVVGGVLMMASMTPIGVLAGAILITDGANGITKEIINLMPGNHQKSEGAVADQFMGAARYMGFKPESGLALYNGITLGASIYSIAGLTRKAGAWRLFRWLPRDYYRKVDTMSKPKLTMKIVDYGIKAKVIFDLMSTDDQSR